MGILATVESFCNNPCNVKKYFATIINPIVKGRLLFKFVRLLFKVFLNLSLRDSRAAAERRSKGRNGVDGFDRVTSATLRNIEKAWKLSQTTKERGYFTFQYPPVLDPYGLRIVMVPFSNCKGN